MSGMNIFFAQVRPCLFQQVVDKFFRLRFNIALAGDNLVGNHPLYGMNVDSRLIFRQEFLVGTGVSVTHILAIYIEKEKTYN